MSMRVCVRCVCRHVCDVIAGMCAMLCRHVCDVYAGKCAI
jgi:hypothetical protein